MALQQTIYTVTEANGMVKALIDDSTLLGNICVRGEISNYKYYPSSGHHYFSLKDKTCVLRCVMFRWAAESHLKIWPENGMQVLAAGRIGVYPQGGAYQLYCERLTPEGAGDLAAAFERSKEKLRREGLFDAARKKPLPAFAERIAIVTSPVGDAVWDMIRILGRRYPLAKVIVLPVQVQGAKAAAEIAGAIRYADRYQIADLLITGRGGGSMEDLWAFNEEPVARAISECSIPVISAVGHEQDFTIADFVADVRASTPSNAAELAVPEAVAIAEQLSQWRRRMEEAQSRRLRDLRQRLRKVQDERVLRSPQVYLQDRQMALGQLHRRLDDLFTRSKIVKTHELDRLHQRLGERMSAIISRRRQDFAATAAALEAMSPLGVWARGYAFVRTETGRVIKDAEDLTLGEHLTVQLGRGSFTALVEGIEKEKRNGREKNRL